MPEDYLSAHWVKLMSALSVEAEVKNYDFQSVIKKYGQSGRYYHTTSHLAAMFLWYEKFENFIEFPNAFRLAIFFHDIVYSPIRKNNESQSAIVAQKYMEKWRCGEEAVVQVRELILSTAKHQPLKAHPDFGWFLDIDLSVLGSPANDYRQYAEAIRKEYRLYPDSLYFPGRKKILESFLQRPRIYFSVPMYELLEKQARENLADEILRLS
ncbi:MAG: hypothetical protein R3D00_21560 [Bacteroidia bacterium]